MMIRPSEAGHYRVLLTDGRWVMGYYISRKDMWVTPDGATALEVIVFESSTRGEASHFPYDTAHSGGTIHSKFCGDDDLLDEHGRCACEILARREAAEAIDTWLYYWNLDNSDHGFAYYDNRERGKPSWVSRQS